VHRCVRRRLYREHCTFSGGAYIKDLALLGRDVGQTIIVDNSPLSFLYHPQNAVACSSFIDEKSDTELDVIAAFLEDVRDAPDVREHCHLWRTWEQKPRTQAGGPLQKASQHHGKKQGKRGFVQAG
jgi:RNA polymerase II subunit A small phosphatase-like protein